MQKRSAGGPGVLAALLCGKCDVFLQELFALTKLEAWDDLLDQVPVASHSTYVVYIRKITHKLHVDFRRRISSVLDACPVKLLTVDCQNLSENLRHLSDSRLDDVAKVFLSQKHFSHRLSDKSLKLSDNSLKPDLVVEARVVPRLNCCR